MGRTDRLVELRNAYWAEIDTLSLTVEPAMTAFLRALGVEETCAATDDDGNRFLLVYFSDATLDSLELGDEKGPSGILEALSEAYEDGLEDTEFLALKAQAAAAAERIGCSLDWLDEFMDATCTLPIMRKGDTVSMMELEVSALA